MAKQIIMEISEILERMEVSLMEEILLRIFSIARVNATREIIKYDFYSQILDDIRTNFEQTDSNMKAMCDFQEELPSAEHFKKPVKVIRLTMQQYKQKNATMERIIPAWNELLELDKEWYGKYNHYRIMQSIALLFAQSYTAVGLLYTRAQHKWDVEKIAEEISKEKREYYMLSGNCVDTDELSAFSVMWNKPLSGMVISNVCHTKRIEKLISEYFKDCDLCEVAIVPIPMR